MQREISDPKYKMVLRIRGKSAYYSFTLFQLSLCKFDSEEGGSFLTKLLFVNIRKPLMLRLELLCFLPS